MSNTKRNIVIVTSEFPPQPGGIGNHAYNLATYLNSNNFGVHVIADQRSIHGEEESDFDQSLDFKVDRIKLRRWRVLMYIRRIQRTFSSFKNASVVIATGKFSLWNVAFCGLIFRRRTIAIVHGSEVNIKTSVIRKSIDLALKRFDHIVAVSNYTKSLIAHLHREIMVIPNGINIKNWNRINTSRLDLKGEIILTTVGRVSSRKGQLNVIKHLPQLIKQFPNLHYHCVGIPSEAEAFKKIASELKVISFVTFHGSVNDTRLKEILWATDIFIMLSTESKSGDVEGFGIAILEANAMGIPAIGAKGCGIEDAIHIGKSGLLIDPKNGTELTESVSEILASKLNYKTGAEAWAKQHDWEHIINSYIELVA